MNVIVIGAGEVGLHISERLSGEGHQVTVIEKDPAKESRLKTMLNAMVVRGSGASIEILETAGVAKADLFIAVTDQDEVNMLACMLAHERGTRWIVARIKNLEYTSREWAQNVRKLGIDLLVNPQKVVAEEIHRIVSYTAASQAAEFADGRVVFLGYAVKRTSPLAGITLKQLAEIRGIYRMVVTAITRQHATLIPRGEDVIQEGDIIYFVCHKADVPAINYLFEFDKQPYKSVFILGGGPIGEALAQHLVATGLRVKIVEPDAALCQHLAEELEDVITLNAEPTDVRTLEHEGIASCDAYVAVTGNEQTNILCSLLAKSYGAKRAIAMVDRHELVTLAPSLGVDACVSARLSMANTILRYVRPRGVASLATVEQGNAEVLDFVVPGKAAVLNRPLRDVELPQGAVIGVIVRAEQVVIPTGDDHLERGDHVIVFALPEAISRITPLFAEP